MHGVVSVNIRLKAVSGVALALEPRMQRVLSLPRLRPDPVALTSSVAFDFSHSVTIKFPQMLQICWQLPILQILTAVTDNNILFAVSLSKVISRILFKLLDLPVGIWLFFLNPKERK